MDKPIDPDRQWLRGQLPADDPDGTIHDRAEKLLGMIKHLKDLDQLPHTIGLFGTWGAGKTTTLAALDQVLETAGYTTIYFNAYKYAGWMEVVPALIYKLISTTPLGKNQEKRERLISIVSSLTAKHAQRFGNWVEQKVGVNVVELAKDISDAGELPDEPSQRRAEMLEQYYTRVDKAQDALVEVFASTPDTGRGLPVVVLIDELDRCDPGEAFEAMKQLRILFNMRRLPIVFVLVANPEPIGMAIRHQYGLGGTRGEYEALRILEKFVDTYMDLSEEIPLAGYVKGIWERLLPKRLVKASFIVGLDARTERAEGHQYEDHTVYNATALESMSSYHPMYANLRAMNKTLVLTATANANEDHLWTLWHLTMLKQGDPSLRRLVASVPHELRTAADSATLEVLRVLSKCGQLSDGRPNSRISLAAHDRHAPYAVFHAAFWDAMHKLTDEFLKSAERGKGESLASLKQQIETMDFLIHTCLFCLSPKGPNGVRVTNLNASRLADAVEGAGPLMDHLGWLLAQY